MRRWYLVLASAVMVAGPSFFAVQQAQASARPKTTTVNIPAEDRFAPFAVTVKVGERVQWVNGDTDDHTVVSDGAFNTAGHDDTDHLILGTASKGGPGQFSLVFHHRVAESFAFRGTQQICTAEMETERSTPGFAWRSGSAPSAATSLRATSTRTAN